MITKIIIIAFAFATMLSCKSTEKPLFIKNNSIKSSGFDKDGNLFFVDRDNKLITIEKESGFTPYRDGFIINKPLHESKPQKNLIKY